MHYEITSSLPLQDITEWTPSPALTMTLLLLLTALSLAGAALVVYLAISPVLHIAAVIAEVLAPRFLS